MDFLDFGDWLADATDFVGAAFTSAAETVKDVVSEGTQEAVQDAVQTVPDVAEKAAESSITEEILAQKVQEAKTPEKLMDWIGSLTDVDKKQIESIINNKMLMAGIAGGAGAWLKDNAQNKQIEAQDRRDQAQRDWKTEEQKRRGQPANLNATITHKPLAGGLVASRMGGG